MRAPARAAEFTFKWGHATQLNHPLHVNAVRVKNEVLARSKGRLRIELFPNNQLGGDPAMLTQVRSGAMQLYAGYGGIFASVAPLAGIEGVGFAFKNQAQALAAFDGPLGALVRKQMDEKGLRHLRAARGSTASARSPPRPSRSAPSPTSKGSRSARRPPRSGSTCSRRWARRRPRSRPARCTPRCRRTSSTRQENPFTILETYRLFEVQKYVSVTNHMWSNFWLVANAEAYKSLPPDLQTILRDAINKYALTNRREMELSNASLAEKMSRVYRMQVNAVDTAPFRAKLKPFYASERADFGETAWGLLERSVGALGDPVGERRT